MKKLTKIGIATGIGASVITSMHIVNKFITRISTVNHITNNRHEQFFSWKLGNVAYTVTGKGSPVLLIHDLDSASSSFEWNYTISLLSKNHRVYAIDLLGCGHSDKPECTYTTYMYTQLINDFVVNIIHKKVSVVATGKSTPIALMTAYNNPYLFEKIILVNPQSINDALTTPSKYDSIKRHITNSPILGTLLYNFKMSRKNIHDAFINNYFCNSNSYTLPAINAYHETSHLSIKGAKFLYSSVNYHYTTVSVSRAISQLDNCIYIVSGENEAHAKEINAEYLKLNPAIETAVIKCTKHLPQLELPIDFVKLIRVYL